MESRIGNKESGSAALLWAGHSFILAGLSVPLAAVALALAGGPERFDLGFVLQVGLGVGLLRGSKAVWWVALVLCALLTVGGALIPALVLLGGGESLTVMGARNPAPDLAFLGGAGLLAIGSPLLALLWRGDPRRHLRDGASPSPSTKRLAAFYGLGLLLLVPAGASLWKQVRRESILPVTRSSPGARIGVLSVAVDDGGSPVVTAIDLWIIGEAGLSTSCTLDPDAPRVSVEGTSFPIAPAKSWIFVRPVRGPKGTSNVVLVGRDGRIVRVPRRVTPANEAAAEGAAAGFADLADLERRLLVALPPE